MDVVRYYLDHEELGVCGCAQNLGVGYSAVQDALDVLKKAYQYSGKITKAIYLEISGKTEAAKKQNCWISIFRMLKCLGVSRAGYRS